MLVLLPPSETKRDGGDEGMPLDLSALRHPALTGRREALVDAVVTLAERPEDMMRALKLGVRQAGEVERNRALRTSPTMPAMDRYTGVLYDALDAPTLGRAARERAARHVRIHSALFGLLSAADPIPAYRLSYDSRLPIGPLKAHWQPAVSEELDGYPGLLLDLRSTGYAALGPAPARPGSVVLRVLGRGEDGRVAALNHFNKKAKGLFTRSLLETSTPPGDLAELLSWARDAGWELEAGDPGVLDLVV